MAIAGSQASQSQEIESKIEKLLKDIERLLGSKDIEKQVLDRLKTSNQGDIALTLKNLRSNLGEEGLREFVVLYTELEYLKAERDFAIGNTGELRKDVISIKIVLEVFNRRFTDRKIEPEFMGEVNYLIKELK